MSQGWKLDGTDFFNFGVWVTKSSGVLSMPKAVDVSTDWLDEEGLDYWQPIGDQLAQNRLIVLNCFIESDSFANFKTAVDTFYTALLSAGQRDLTVPYLVGTIECYLDSKIEMKNSNYIRTQQIGVFTLNLTVREDSRYKQITVYKSDDTVRGVFNYDNKFKIFKKLQGANYASFPVENNTILDIQRNDYVLLSHVTGITDKYYLERDPEIKKISTNKYVHQLRFEYEGNLLNRVDFLILDNAETSYFGDAEDVIDRLIENTQIDYTGVFTKGTIVGTTERNHQFANQNCYQVLQQMAKDYEIEFDLKTVGGSVEISLVAQIGTSVTPGLAYGKGNGLFTLTRDSINNEDLTTVLHAFGSTKNLPDTYAFTRLKCTTFPIESNKATYGAYSKTKNFDEIFPEYTGTVSTYFRDLTDDGVDVTTYYITDAAIPFDINSFLLPQITPKIVFKTGDLSGYEFQIKRYDDTTKRIYFIEFKNPRGAILPSSTLFPVLNDTYTIVDIDLPASYVTDAETRLLAAANTYIATKDNPKVTYRGRVTASYQYDVVLNGYDIGDNVPITDTDFGLVAAEQRISDLTYNVFFGSYDLILSEAPLITFRESVKQRLDEVEKTQDATEDQDTITIRKRRTTGYDVETSLLDPSDTLLDLDRRGRNRSVDPRHQNEESGTIDYSIKDLDIWVNYLDDTEKIRIAPGSITIHNWRPSTLNRFDIRDVTNDYANPENYNPVKTFTIAEDIIDLPTTDAYFIYAKVASSGSPTTGAIVTDTTVHKRLHYDEDFFLYKLAEVTQGGQDRFAYPLFGNTKSAQIDSANLTGTPTAPTPAAADSSTKIATTAFVGGELGVFGLQEVTDINAITTNGITTGGLIVNGQLTSALTGTVSVTIATDAVVGIGTLFTTELNIGDAIKIAGEIFTVSAISDNLNLTLDSNHAAGASGVTAFTDPDFLSINNGDSVNQLLLDKSGDLSVLGVITHAAPLLSTQSALLSDVEALDLQAITDVGNSTTDTLIHAAAILGTESVILSQLEDGSIDIDANSLSVGGANINTGGTLSNVAYLDQSNVFTAVQNIGDATGSPTLIINKLGSGIGTIEFNNGGTKYHFIRSLANETFELGSLLAENVTFYTNNIFRGTIDANTGVLNWFYDITTTGQVTHAAATLSTQSVILSQLEDASIDGDFNSLAINGTPVGTVTSVAFSSSDLSFSGSPITGAGTFIVNIGDSAIPNQSPITSGLAGTDEFFLSASGFLKRMDVSVLETYMQDNLAFGSLWTDATGHIHPTTTTNKVLIGGSSEVHAGILEVQGVAFFNDPINCQSIFLGSGDYLSVQQISSPAITGTGGVYYMNSSSDAPEFRQGSGLSSKIWDLTNASGYEKNADPATITGGYVMWQSDGTGSGDDGDIMIKINDGSTTKTITLVDFSAF